MHIVRTALAQQIGAGVLEVVGGEIGSPWAGQRNGVNVGVPCCSVGVLRSAVANARRRGSETDHFAAFGQVAKHAAAADEFAIHRHRRQIGTEARRCWCWVVATGLPVGHLRAEQIEACSVEAAARHDDGVLPAHCSEVADIEVVPIPMQFGVFAVVEIHHGFGTAAVKHATAVWCS